METPTSFSQAASAAQAASATVLLDAVGSPVLMLSETGAVLLANSAARRMFAAQLAEKSDCVICDLVHPDSHHRFADLPLPRSPHHLLDVRLIDQGTHKSWADIACEYVILGERQVWLLTLTDTTAYKMALSALDEVYEQLYLIADHSVDVITVTDTTGRITFESPSIYRLVGYTAEERLGTMAWEQIHPDDLDAVLTAASTMSADSDTMRLEFRSRHKDGHYVWLESNARMVWNTALGISGIITVTRDVTERRRIEEALQRSERLLQETGRIAKVGGWEFDLAKNTVTWTQALYSILEMPPSYVPTPDDLIRFYAPSDVHLFEHTLGAAVFENQPYDYEVQMVTGKGRQLWVRSIGTPVSTSPLEMKIVGAFQDITDQKAAELALRHSHERYRTLFEKMTDAVFILDPDGNHVDANPQAAKVFGYPAEELGRMSFRQTVIPEEQPQSEQIRERLLRGEIIPPYERFFRRADGSMFPAEISVQMIRDTDGTPQYIQSVIRDITDRKLSELALYESEARYRMLAENVTDLVSLHDHDGRMRYVSPSFTRFAGYLPQELLGKTPVKYTIQEDFERVLLPGYQRVLRGDSIQRMEFRFRKKSGELVWMGANAAPIFDETGRVIQFLVTTRDISVQHQMQQALLESSKRFRLVIENSFDLLIMINSASDIIYISPSIERITGHLRDDIGQMRDVIHLLEMIHPEDGRVLFIRLQQMIHNDLINSDIALLRFRHKAGHWIWMETSATNLIRERGVEAVVINARDITARMQALEAERRQHALTQALLDSASALNSTLEFDEVVERLLLNVGQVIPHDSANIMLIENGNTRVVGHRGYLPEDLLVVVNSRLSVEDTPNLREIVVQRSPFIISDTNVYPGWKYQGLTDVVKSIITAPVVVENQVLGFINLDSRQPNFFEQAHIETIKVFAAQAAIAIKNTRAYEQAHELAALHERQRLARELHDAVSQTLFSASVIAETLPLLIQHSPDDVLSGLDQLSRLTKGALAEMRTLLVELRPAALADTDLSILMTNLINSLRTRTDAMITLKIDGKERGLPTDVKINLYRIAQESLNNIIKHANALSIHVMLVFALEGITLTVIDDGRGFNTNEIAQGRMGLKIMRERAESVNILLTTTTEVGRGTHVKALWKDLLE